MESRTPNLDRVKPFLSPDVFFLSLMDHRYLFAPFTRTYSAINADMEALLRLCDGTRPVEELIRRHELGENGTELFETFLRKDILRPHEEQEKEQNKTETEKNDARPISHLTLFPTHACNLNCVYCYARGGEHPSFMSEPIAEAAFNFFFDQLPKDLNYASLSFHGGGEPTLAFPFIKDAGESFRSRCQNEGKQCRISMVTNGTFGENVRNWIIDQRIGANFSFDGPQQVQDKLRPFANGAGSHARVTENMQILQAAGLPLTVRATVTADSLPQMDALVDECLQLGVAALQMEPCFNVGRCTETGVQEPEPTAFAQRFLDAYRKGLAQDMDVTYSGLRCVDTPKDRFCGACGDSFAVTPEGEITTCYEVVQRKDPAAELFFVGKVDTTTQQVHVDEERLSYLRSRVTSNLSVCRNCFLKYNCAGDCVVKAFRARGNIFKRVPERCKMAEIINRQIIAWVADGEIVPREKSAFESFIF